MLHDFRSDATWDYRDREMGPATPAASDDIERRGLDFADSKTGAKRIPLKSAAISLLDDVAQRSAWVIPGRDPCELRVNLAKPWERTRETRRGAAARSLPYTRKKRGGGTGLSLHQVGALLGHRQPVPTARYAHLAEDPVRDASERVGNRLASAMQGSNAGQPPTVRRTYH
jgi:hypothetical protein